MGKNTLHNMRKTMIGSGIVLLSAVGFLGDHEVLLFSLDLSRLIGSLDLSVGVHRYTIGTVYVNFFVIPEVPWGTISIILAMLGALGVHKTKSLTIKRRNRRRQ